MVRIVQMSDTHFSAAAGTPASWTRCLAWLRADPPHLVVHTGDVVYADPDDAADRAFARSLLDAVPAPLYVIPGNHDVGFYDDADDLPRRLDAFRATWSGDRFVHQLGTWRIVGCNAYLLGDDSDAGRAHDAWLAAAVGDVTSHGPTALFVHQPPLADRTDGWEMPSRARRAFASAIATAPPAFVASGHRHCAARHVVDGVSAVWAPSLTIESSRDNPPWLHARGASDVHPGTGVLEHLLADDGSWSAHFVAC